MKLTNAVSWCVWGCHWLVSRRWYCWWMPYCYCIQGRNWYRRRGSTEGHVFGILGGSIPQMFWRSNTLHQSYTLSFDLAFFPIIGRILSHGYLVTGILPIRIAFPTLTCMLLGPSASITKEVLLDSFLDFISCFEWSTLKRGLAHSKDNTFPSDLQDKLITTLARFGCRLLPTPSNLMNVIQQIAQYEFLTKPAAGISMIHSGIPLNHRQFWSSKSSSDVQGICQRLSVTATKVNSLFSFPEVYTQQES